MIERILRASESLLLDRAWIDPIVAVVAGATLALPLDQVTTVADHSAFFQTLAGLVGTLLTLAVLAITISLSRDLSSQVRGQLKVASRGLIVSLFGSLAWLVVAALLACGAYLVEGAGAPSWLLTGYVLATIVLCLLPTFRIGVFLIKLFSLEFASRS